jgi:hypothetical protein
MFVEQIWSCRAAVLNLNIFFSKPKRTKIKNSRIPTNKTNLKNYLSTYNNQSILIIGATGETGLMAGHPSLPYTSLLATPPSSTPTTPHSLVLSRAMPEMLLTFSMG